MAIFYNKVIHECMNLLGGVLGSNPTSADANYTTTPSVATAIGPDFLPVHALDAIISCQGEIVEAIASTPLHPGRARFGDVTSALSTGAAIPRTGAGTGKLIIGVPGAVRDSSDSRPLTSNTLEEIRSFN